jgi:hypothetical protein
MAANYSLEQLIDSEIKVIEEYLGRPLVQSQKQGLHNSGSLMFFEAMIQGFYYAKEQNKEAVEAWLQEIDGFERN